MPVEAGAPSLARSEGAACLDEVVARFADRHTIGEPAIRMSGGETWRARLQTFVHS